MISFRRYLIESSHTTSSKIKPNAVLVEAAQGAGANTIPPEVEKCEERLAATRFFLHKHFPLFYTILNKMSVVYTLDLPTMAVDDKGNVYINPEFGAITLTFPEFIGVIIHELFHVANLTHARVQYRNFKLWNICTDVIMNRDILDNLSEFIANLKSGKIKLPGITTEQAMNTMVPALPTEKEVIIDTPTGPQKVKSRFYTPTKSGDKWIMDITLGDSELAKAFDKEKIDPNIDVTELSAEQLYHIIEKVFRKLTVPKKTPPPGSPPPPAPPQPKIFHPGDIVVRNSDKKEGVVINATPPDAKGHQDLDIAWKNPTTNESTGDIINPEDYDTTNIDGNLPSEDFSKKGACEECEGGGKKPGEGKEGEGKGKEGKEGEGKEGEGKEGEGKEGEGKDGKGKEGEDKEGKKKSNQPWTQGGKGSGGLEDILNRLPTSMDHLDDLDKPGRPEVKRLPGSDKPKQWSEKDFVKEIQDAINTGGRLTKQKEIETKTQEETAKKLQDKFKASVDWKKLLTQMIAGPAETRYTFQKPARRYLGHGIYMPSKRPNPTTKFCALAIDTSGSIREEWIARFVNEAHNCIVKYKATILLMLYSDDVYFSKIYNAKNASSIYNLKFQQGGNGEDHIWAYIAANGLDNQIKSLIVLTDGYFQTKNHNQFPPVPQGVDLGFVLVPGGTTDFMKNLGKHTVVYLDPKFDEKKKEERKKQFGR